MDLLGQEYALNKGSQEEAPRELVMDSSYDYSFNLQRCPSKTCQGSAALSSESNTAVRPSNRYYTALE